MAKPIVTIDNFSNVHPKGLYWLDGMSSHFIGGQSLLSPSWVANKMIDKNDSGYTNLNVLDGMTPVTFNDDNSFNKQIIGIDNGYIFAFDALNQNNIGQIHQVANYGSGTDEIFRSSYPDIISTIDNNLLYSSANHLGVAWLGICDTGSGTTKIIDSAGRDLTTLGISTSTGSNKVVNLNTKEEFTITSISTTNSTNDTLNFTAGTNTNSADDLFLVFVDNRFKFNVESKQGQQFANQDKPYNWIRQIKLIDDYYYILNGNYLARLGYDESTWTSDVLDETAKQLPKKHQAQCFAFNQNRILVGTEYNGQGALCLTNGWDDGWASIIYTDRKPSAITPYKSGWAVMVEDVMYYTNGYVLEKLFTLPDSGSFRNSSTAHYNGIVTIQNDILIAVNGTDYNRKKSGYFAFNPEKGLVYFPPNSEYNSTVGALIYSFDGIFGSNSYTINSVSNYENKKSSVILYQKLPQKIHLSKVGLNLSPKFDDTNLSSGDVKITVAIGDANKPLWYGGMVGSGSTKTSIINTNGAYTNTQVGDEILMFDGNVAGERSFITAISNQGTATETLTIFPVLSADPTSTEFNIIHLKKTDTKTIDPTDIDDTLYFLVDGLYDKFYLEVYIESPNNSFIDINSIEVYG